MQSHALADGGSVLFDKEFFSASHASHLFDRLQREVAWKQEQGRNRYPFPRLTAWYADPGIRYTYSGVTHQANDWLPVLSDIRDRVRDTATHAFNSLLLNYYRHGQDSIGFHADDEPELGTNPLIASVSLGATRPFVLRHNDTGQKVMFDLTHGSLLIMGGTTQHFWKHTIPKTNREVRPRINLTFRRTGERAP